MKFCRFLPLKSEGKIPPVPSYGILDEKGIRQIVGMPWGHWAEMETRWDLQDVRLLAPVAPSKIVCVGRNYAAHAAELGNDVPREPLIFLKPPSSIIGPGDPIVLTRYSQSVEHEGELGLVIGKKCSHLGDDEDPLAFLLGYTCLN